jgi:hypothetical protein
MYLLRLPESISGMTFSLSIINKMKNKHILLLSGLLIVLLGTTGYFRSVREKVYPDSYLQVIAEPWHRNEAPVINVRMKNTSWLTPYAGTGLLITYEGPGGKKLGTDRFSYPEPVEPGEEVLIPIQVHPDLYPLQETTKVTVKLEWTGVSDVRAMNEE